MIKIFHHSLKKHPKINKIAKVGGEMLENMENIVARSFQILYTFVSCTNITRKLGYL